MLTRNIIYPLVRPGFSPLFSSLSLFFFNANTVLVKRILSPISDYNTIIFILDFPFSPHQHNESFRSVHWQTNPVIVKMESGWFFTVGLFIYWALSAVFVGYDFGCEYQQPFFCVFRIPLPTYPPGLSVLALPAALRTSHPRRCLACLSRSHTALLSSLLRSTASTCFTAAELELLIFANRPCPLGAWDF